MTNKKIFFIGLFTALGCMILGGVIGASKIIFGNYFPKGYILFSLSPVCLVELGYN